MPGFIVYFSEFLYLLYFDGVTSNTLRVTETTFSYKSSALMPTRVTETSVIGEVTVFTGTFSLDFSRIRSLYLLRVIKDLLVYYSIYVVVYVNGFHKRTPVF
jgi:hypothetical protein